MAMMTYVGRWGHVWFSGKHRNARKYHLTNMWIWFNAGLVPVAEPLHIVCVSRSPLFCLLCGLHVLLYFMFFVREFEERRLIHSSHLFRVLIIFSHIFKSFLEGLFALSFHLPLNKVFYFRTSLDMETKICWLHFRKLWLLGAYPRITLKLGRRTFTSKWAFIQAPNEFTQCWLCTSAQNKCLCFTACLHFKWGVVPP